MTIMVIIMSHNHIKLFHCFADAFISVDKVATLTIPSRNTSPKVVFLFSGHCLSSRMRNCLRCSSKLIQNVINTAKYWWCRK